MSVLSVAVVPEGDSWTVLSTGKLRYAGWMRSDGEHYAGLYAYPFPTLDSAVEAAALYEPEVRRAWASTLQEIAGKDAGERARILSAAATREELAREVFTLDNSGQSEQASRQDWAMLSAASAHSLSHYYRAADALLARGWTRHREIDGAGLASFTGYACIVKKGNGVVFNTWDGKQWESPGSYTGYSTEELAADGPYLVLLEGETA